MQSSTPREFGWFTGWLEDSDRIVIVQDGEAVSARQLRNLALRGAGQFNAFAGHRIALHASRADVTFAALAAAQAVQAELLLVRELYPSGHTFWVDNEISAVFDERLEGRPVPGGRANYRSPAVLLTTSGTTGQPKVALHSLEKLVGRVRAGSADARWLLTYHPGSFAGLQVLLTAVAGRGVLLAYAGLSAAQTVRRALDSGATHLSGTPTFWRALLLARGAGTPPPDFRQITLGGEAVDQSTLDALQAAFPAARIIHIYASTEAGALFAVKDGRAGFPAAWLTAGVEGCRLRIRDGMLEVQSPRAMQQYAREDSRNVITADGWLMTGDLVEQRGDRVLFAGRADNVINVGGGKVMPEQVEAVLAELSFVKEARVSGVRNPLAGIVLAAEVVLSEPRSEADARQEIFAALSRRLEAYKIPRLYRFVDCIPTNAVGKKVRTNL